MYGKFKDVRRRGIAINDNVMERGVDCGGGQNLESCKGNLEV